MGWDKLWSPLEALNVVANELPAPKHQALLRGLGIDQGVVNRIHDAIYAAGTSGSRADDDVFAALLEARNVLNTLKRTPKEMFDGIDATIHRGHLDYVMNVAIQMPKANVGDLYDNDPRYASALVHLIPNFEYPDWSWKTTGAMSREVVAQEGVARESNDVIAPYGSKIDPWRFENGFVDDVLYYASGQRLYEAAVSHGETDEAGHIAGLFNLAHQKELSGFTLESFGRDWDDAHRENILLDAKFMGLTNIDPAKLARTLEGDGPERGMFVGNIVGVDAEKGLVFQATGRGDGVVLPLGKLSRPVEVGEMATIVFKDGRGTVADRGQVLDRGR